MHNLASLACFEILFSGPECPKIDSGWGWIFYLNLGPGTPGKGTGKREKKRERKSGGRSGDRCPCIE